jgi:outer membrane receptor protein involved in Fe transport
MRRSCIPFAFVAVLVCADAIAFAQTTGDISGRVTDTSATPLPGVTIEATSPSLPGVRTNVTDRDGLYRIPAIPPGTYRVLATLSGFRPVEKTCTVTLDSSMTVNLTLRLQTEEHLLVSGETPPIDLTSTTTGTSYTADVIIRLPVGRNYADIVRANPGVSTDVGDTEGRFLALSIYGATSAENQWIIDGINTTNVYKGIQGKAINSEFVQEVEVKTGGYPAEYGRALGGVINVITKSGGNAFHGDSFVYYDSTNTTAQQRFEPGDSELASMRVPEAKRLDYGADMGGFLVKDRLWFFAAYDRVTLDGHLSRVESSTYVSKEDQFPFDAAENLYSGKLTWNATASTAVVGTVFADPSSTSGATGADPRQGLNIYVRPIVSPDRSTWYSERTQGGTDYGLRLTQLFGSRALATLRGSYHRDRNTLTADEGIQYTDWTCAGGTRERRCAFPPDPNAIWGGYGRIHLTESSRRQYVASVGIYGGNHELKAGGDYMDGRTDWLTHNTGGQIVQVFNEFGELYYEHRYHAVSPTDPTPAEGDSRGAQVLDYGAYLQDSWRAAPGLTINPGLRWDGETTRNYYGDTVLRFDDGWQPRVGVAWDPWRDGRTKLYAFAGRFSYAFPTTAATISFGNFTSFRVFNLDPVSLVQDPNVFGHGRRQGGGGAFGSAVDAGLKAATRTN